MNVSSRVLVVTLLALLRPTSFSIAQIPEFGQLGHLSASDAELNDLFGFSVAVAGEVSVASAVFDDDLGTDSGSVHVFREVGTEWSFEQKLTASDGLPFHYFGFATATDATRILVGAPLHYDATGVSLGRVYEFQFDGTAWTETGQLVALDGEMGDGFGSSIALRGDLAVVGSIGAEGSGAVYVFRLSGGQWQQEAKLIPSDGELGDWFGFSVAIGDQRLLVGAPSVDAACPVDPLCDSGAVYSFRCDGSALFEEQVIRAYDEVRDSGFGASVAVDNDYAVVGSHLRDDLCGNLDCNSGAAYLYRLDGSNWEVQQKLGSRELDAADRFGHSVAIRGTTVVVGATSASAALPRTGAVYVFEEDGGTWTDTRKLVVVGSRPGDFVGRSVAASGPHVVVGAMAHDSTCPFSPDCDAGAAFVFSVPLHFVRGDCGEDGVVDVSDAVRVLEVLFLPTSTAPDCELACDSNDDGRVDVSDAVRLLSFLFVPGTESIPPPTAACGTDPSVDSLTCRAYSSCP